MARIRSVHPGLFTDEAFMSLSDAAQVFFIGLWTEADDQGVFEWKPLTLRVRLRPAKDGPVDPLLDEIEAVGAIKSFEYEGKRYGVIRNFRKFQNPKTPNSVHPIPEDWEIYVALPIPGAERRGRKPKQFPQNGEKRGGERTEIPQNGKKNSLMEDGGWRMEEEREDGKESPSLRSGVCDQPELLPPGGNLPATTEVSPGGKTVKKLSGEDSWPSDFREQFWAAYPRKIEKKAAIAALERVRKSAVVPWPKLIGAVRAYAAAADPDFTKHPTTWLNKGCWDDEIKPRASGAKRADGSYNTPSGFSPMVDIALAEAKRSMEEGR